MSNPTQLTEAELELLTFATIHIDGTILEVSDSWGVIDEDYFYIDNKGFLVIVPKAKFEQPTYEEIPVPEEVPEDEDGDESCPTGDCDCQFDNCNFCREPVASGGIAKGDLTNVLGPFNFIGGQVAKIIITNNNVLNAAFTISFTKPSFQDPSTHLLLPGQSVTIDVGIFTEGQVDYSFKIDTPSSVLLLDFEAYSTDNCP